MRHGDAGREEVRARRTGPGRLPLVVVVASVLAAAAPAQDAAPGEASRPGSLGLELNALTDEGEACRMTFLATNATGADIEGAVFETVIFDAEGAVERLTLFDFRDLPVGRPRVRQFDLGGLACNDVGRVLINGAQSCAGEGAEAACTGGRRLSSRVDVELLG